MTQLSTLVKEFQVLVQAGRKAEIIRRLKEPPFKNTHLPAFNLVRARFSFRAGDFSTAKDALAQAQECGAAEGAVLVVRSWLQRNDGDRKGLTVTAQRMAKLQPQNGMVYAQLSGLDLSANDFVAAEQAARTALELDPTLPLAHRALYNAVLASPRPHRVFDVLMTAAAAASKLPDFPALRLTLAGLARSDSQVVSDALAARWPMNISSVNGLIKTSLQAKKSVESICDEAFSLAVTGHKDDARALLRREPDQSGVVKKFPDHEEIVKVIEKIPGPGQRQRAIIVDQHKEITCSVPTESGETIIFFTGFADRAMIDITVFDTFAAQAGLGAIYLRDFSRKLYMDGLGSLGSGRKKTLDFLCNELATMGTRRLIVVGSSAGGFAAIRYGIDLSADRIVGFSSPTAINSDNLVKFGDGRGKILVRRLQNTVTPAEQDLKPLVAEANVPDGLALYYGLENAIDCAHACHLKNLPNVTLHPIADRSLHNSIFPVLGSGRLAEIITGRQGIFPET